MIWREKQWLLAAIGTLLLLNIAFFFTYRVRYHARVEELDARLSAAEQRLQSAQASRMRSEQELQSYRRVEKGIEAVYQDRWSTPELRMTRLLQEISQLAVNSQMIPQSTSYSQSELKRESDITTMGIAFGVSGSYQRVRRLVNLLELSEEFVIIRSISIANSSADSSVIQLNLQLETLFREPRGGGPRL